MPEWGYSTAQMDPDRMVKASGRDLRISPKEAREICDVIKDMEVDTAMKYLELVIKKKEGVPYRRFNSNVPHHRELSGRFGVPAGRYPINASTEILNVLKNAKANAENKGLDTERLRITHACAQAAMRLKNYIQRAHGRSSPYFHPLTHVEIILEEISA